jgi:hypothetical protein
VPLELEVSQQVLREESQEPQASAQEQQRQELALPVPTVPELPREQAQRASPLQQRALQQREPVVAELPQASAVQASALELPQALHLRPAEYGEPSPQPRR